MSVPVTNQPYSQQNNQLFEWAKTATGPQIEAAKNGLPKDSPLLLAIGMGVQYQQQARAPQPQAPQKTVMEQKLGEFAQTSAQGLPSVGGNQMAMQQAVQQDPMRNAGIGIAKENTQAPQDPMQAQAATGGLVALAHGGEVRRFEVGGGANVLGGLTSINLGGDPSSPYGQYEAPTLDTAISDMGVPTEQTSPKDDYRLSDMVAPKAKVKPKVKAHHSKKDSAPAPGSSAEAIAASPTAKGETYKEPEVAVTPAKALTAEESIAEYQKLLGPEADMSEEVAMAKEAARGANKEKWGTALTQGIGAYLSAPTRALGAGLMAGASGYSQGAKDEQSANKDLMALQMAQKKSDLAGHRTAAEAYIGQQAKMAEKAAEANATAAGLRFGLQGDLIKGKQRAGFEQEQQATKQLHDIDMATQAQIDKLDLIGATGDMKLRVAKLSPAVRQQLLTTVYNRANKEGMDTTELQTLLDEAEKFTYQTKSQPKGMGQSLAPLGSSGVFYSPKK